MTHGRHQQLLIDLFNAYFDARRNKRQTVNALAFEKNYETKLFRLYEDIVKRRYEIGRSICFMVQRPVKREVFAADFRDRVVHHLIFNYVSPIFERHFIKDSYSCRLGKGTSEGIRRADHFIRSGSHNYQKECWILKLDIKGYFMSMDRNILYQKMENRLLAVKNAGFDVELVLHLLRLVVYNDPTDNCLIKGRREDWLGLPRSKSLFHAAKDKGFPIGNLTSQLFGNVYLDDFDHFVREELKIARYGRYVDDMVLVHEDKELLKAVVPRIKDYLRGRLGLVLHPGKIHLQPFAGGVGFLGVFIKPYRIRIGRRLKHNFYARIREWNGIGEKAASVVAQEAEKIVASANSYLGIMKNYQSYNLRKKMVGLVSEKILKNVVFSEKFEKAELGVQLVNNFQ